MFTSMRSIAALRNVQFPRVYARKYSRKMFENNYRKRIFSGIQPTGSMHIGNYLGAVQTWVRLQNSGEDVIWSIVDMHSITLPHDPKELYGNILKMTATLLACGIDPRRSVLFQQSTVPMHAELCWVLGSITTLARLAHLPQYKEKSETLKNVPLGLYVYPVLQAADILLYKATHVPVGRDQHQHIQLAQDLAISFNKKFGDTFAIPHSLINDHGSQRIRSLQDPFKKMSKSSNDAKGKLEILDEPDILLKKIKKAVTDCTSEVTYEPEKRPGVSNLIDIHSMITGKTPDQICQEVQQLDTGKYKLLLVDVIIEKLSPIREEYSRLIKEPVYLQEVLKNGTEKATEIATDCWHRVRNRIGFGDCVPFMNEKNVQNVMHKV